MFSDIAYFNSTGLSAPGEDIFDMPVDVFLDVAPGQIDTALPHCDLSEYERARFKELLNGFDFTQFQEELDEDALSMPTVPEPHTWEHWSAACHDDDQQSSETALFVQSNDVDDGNVAAAGHQDALQEMSTPPYESEEVKPVIVTDAQHHPEMHAHVQPTLPPMSLPPHVVADPDFQALWTRYLEQKQQQSKQQTSFSEQPSQPQPPPTQATSHELRHQPQPHYPHRSLQHQEQFQFVHAQSAVQCDPSAHDEHDRQLHPQLDQNTRVLNTQSGPSASAPVPVSIPDNHYVPPAGAISSHHRRVAGSWRLPAAQQEVPRTPVDAASGSHQHPWAGMAN